MQITRRICGGGAHKLKSEKFSNDLREAAAGRLKDNKLETVEDYKRHFADLEEMFDFIVNVYESLGRTVERSTEPIRPNYPQIEPDLGVILNFSYGRVDEAYFRLGMFPVIRSISLGSNRNALEEAREIFIEKLGLVEIIPEQKSSRGCGGPTYVVTKGLNGDLIPKEKFVNKNRYVSHEKAKELWNEAKPKGREPISYEFCCALSYK